MYQAVFSEIEYIRIFFLPETSVTLKFEPVFTSLTSVKFTIATCF